jgi:hypothetical protein
MGTHRPDADPRSRRSIETWISGYRRTLGPSVESRTGRYLLDVHLQTIDAHRFENRIASSRTVRSDGAVHTDMSNLLASSGEVPGDAIRGR